MSADFITLVANIALTLSFIIALVFGVAQVKAAARDRKERLTLETVRSFHTRDFIRLLQFLNAHELPPTYEQFQALPAEEQVNYIQFAQEMESLGIVVAERLINIDLVDKILGSFVVTSWEKYKTMFLDMRVKMSDPFLGEYFPDFIHLGVYCCHGSGTNL